MEFFLSFRIRFADLPRIRCCLPAVERRMRPPPVALNRFAAARFVFILGMLLSSLEGSLPSANRGRGAENAGDSAPPTPVKPIGGHAAPPQALQFRSLADPIAQFASRWGYHG